MSRFCTPSSSFLLSSCLQCKFPRISKSCSRMQIFCFSSHHPPTVSAPHISSRCVIFPRRPNVFPAVLLTFLPPSQESSGLLGESSPGLSSSKRLSKSNIDISAPNEGHVQSRPPLSRKQSDSYDGDTSSTGQHTFFPRWERDGGMTWVASTTAKTGRSSFE